MVDVKFFIYRQNVKVLDDKSTIMVALKLKHSSKSLIIEIDKESKDYADELITDSELAKLVTKAKVKEVQSYYFEYQKSKEKEITHLFKLPGFSKFAMYTEANTGDADLEIVSEKGLLKMFKQINKHHLKMLNYSI